MPLSTAGECALGRWAAPLGLVVRHATRDYKDAIGQPAAAHERLPREEDDGLEGGRERGQQPGRGVEPLEEG
eukprot:scaffold132538_cov69-Phaeocystis_antarctica.AAC.7